MKITKIIAPAVSAFISTASLFAEADNYYVNPNSSAAKWVEANPNDSRTALIASRIASVPMARWFTGTSQATSNLKSYVSAYTAAANRAGKIPILVAYNIPGRDCSGGASSGGASSAAEYKEWISAFISGIGPRPAVVILEPDAIPDIDCLSEKKRTERISALFNAIEVFKTQAPLAKVYLDAGNPYWKPAATTANFLNESGLSSVAGFSLNVSNFYTTAQNKAYADQINAWLLSNKGYTKPILIDTSRNGSGANPGDWCNPPGRKIGTTTQPLSPSILAVWVKVPGNSDGASSPTTNCHSGAPAGSFTPEAAVKLISGQ